MSWVVAQFEIELGERFLVLFSVFALVGATPIAYYLRVCRSFTDFELQILVQGLADLQIGAWRWIVEFLLLGV